MESSDGKMVIDEVQKVEKSSCLSRIDHHAYRRYVAMVADSVTDKTEVIAHKMKMMTLVTIKMIFTFGRKVIRRPTVE